MFHFDSVIWKLLDELEHKHQQLPVESKMKITGALSK